MKKCSSFITIALIILGLTSCTNAVYVSGAPIALATSPEFPDDGALVWETAFEWEFNYNCPHCFTYIAGRVLIQSDTGRIYGLDAETGEIAWHCS